MKTEIPKPTVDFANQPKNYPSLTNSIINSNLLPLLQSILLSQSDLLGKVSYYEARIVQVHSEENGYPGPGYEFPPLFPPQVLEIFPYNTG